MKSVRACVNCLLSVLLLVACPTSARTGQGHAGELVGLWETTRRLGPEVRGELTLTKKGDGWRAEIAGFAVDARLANDLIHVEIPGNRGSFRGAVQKGGQTIRGFWTQPGVAFLGNRFSSPVVLDRLGEDRWRGRVVPLEDTVRFHLVVERGVDENVTAFIRNPEFNLGVFMTIDRVEKNGNQVKFWGRYRRSDQVEVLAEGRYFPENGRLSLDVPFVQPAGTYDLFRVEDDEVNSFYPRRAVPEKYVYRPPREEGDGWSASTLEEVGISRKGISDFIQMLIDMGPESVDSSDIHAVLIARRGKLVLEEYFHGFHRELPHDTRSASKSLASILVGAAIHAGLPIDASDSVWELIDGNRPPEDLDAAKRRVTIEHLLTMSSGLGCDDWSASLPGEDEMQAETDWRRFILDLPVIREPGEHAAYCAGALNLVGPALEAVAHTALPEIIDRLVAQPLQIGRYYLNLTSNGKAYLGGGIHWLPRDFMKLGQLLLDQGQFNGRRILSREWARKTVTSFHELGSEADYGYAWWVRSYPHNGRQVKAFFAGGNGGQIVMGFPELDLLVAFYGGNYNSQTLFRAQREFVPDYILPAVDARRPGERTVVTD